VNCKKILFQDSQQRRHALSPYPARQVLRTEKNLLIFHVYWSNIVLLAGLTAVSTNAEEDGKIRIDQKQI